MPDWTPAADVILLNKHDGTNGYILTLLTTGILRTTINATNYDSTVATGITDNYVAVIDVDITRETASVAGSVVFTLNGVILGASVAITATGDTTTELVTNGNFATDTDWTKGTGWTIAAGFATKVAGVASSLSQTVTLVPGRTYAVTFTATRTAGTVVPRFTGTTDVSATGISASGTYTVYLTAVTGNNTVAFAATSTFAGTIDDVSVKSVLLTVDNTSSLYVCGTSAVRSASQWFSHRLFNRAKTVAQNLGMFVNGVPFADIGASQTPVYAGDYSVGVDSVTTTTGTTLTGNIDGIDAENDWLRVERTGATGNNFCLLPVSGLVGKQVRTSIKIHNATGSGVSYFYISYVNSPPSATQQVVVAIAAGTTKTISLDAILSRTTTIAVAPCTIDGNNTNVATSSIYYVKESFIYKSGCTSELLSENAQSNTGQVLDTSGNKQHALLPAAGASIMGAISARRGEVRWTNTWAGTNELQYIGGVNQAILPSNAYIESIVGTVSGATPHDIIVGDGSDTDRYVTITTGLAAGTTSFTVAARTTDGTNLKLTVDPDTNATMSIAWVITYYQLET